MLYEGWISVNLNLTPRVSSRPSGFFFIKNRLIPWHKTHMLITVSITEMVILYKYDCIIIIIIIITYLQSKYEQKNINCDLFFLLFISDVSQAPTPCRSKGYTPKVRVHRWILNFFFFLVAKWNNALYSLKLKVLQLLQYRSKVSYQSRCNSRNARIIEA